MNVARRILGTINKATKDKQGIVLSRLEEYTWKAGNRINQGESTTSQRDSRKRKFKAGSKKPILPHASKVHWKTPAALFPIFQDSSMTGSQDKKGIAEEVHAVAIPEGLWE